MVAKWALAAVAAAAIATPLLGTISPAGAASAHRAHAFQLRDETSFGSCINLAAGHRVSARSCRPRHAGQQWSLDGSRLRAGSGRCLAASKYGQVTMARCGTVGTGWSLIALTSIPWHVGQIESRRYPGYCLDLPPSYVGPVQLDTCNDGRQPGDSQEWLQFHS